jgi:hypothetical protein
MTPYLAARDRRQRRRHHPSSIDRAAESTNTIR